MRQTLTRLTERIGDMAADVGLRAAAVGDLDTLDAARAAVALLDAQAAMNKARDLLGAAEAGRESPTPSPNARSAGKLGMG